MFSEVVVSCGMREWGWIRGIATVIAFASGCANHSPDEAAQGEGAQRELTVPKDRADCLEPPWTPDGSSSGVRVTQCKDERIYRVVLGNGDPVSDEVQEHFLDAHRDELHAMDGVVGSGWGLCCGVEDEYVPGESCLTFDLRVCSTPLPDFIEKVRALQAADSDVAKHSIRVAVTLQGPTSPRCASNDDDCGPLPYSDKGAQTPPTKRTLVDAPKPDSERCSQDGECVINGCGNECDYWTLGGEAGACPYISKYEGAFCGCVEDHCAWFH